MDDIALIRALGAGDDKPEAPARAAARQALADAIDPPASASPRRRPPLLRRGFFAVAAAMALAATAAVLLLAAGGSTQSTAPAYGAELVRFAQSTPLLLLERQGWEVRNMYQWREGEGKIEFGPGSADSPVAHISQRHPEHQMAGIRLPGWRKVEVSWSPLSASSKQFLAAPRAHGFSTTMPVLGTTADVDPGRITGTRGGIVHHPHYLRPFAVWREGDQIVTMAAFVHHLGAFRDRLSWLHRVGAESWLEAMPPRVVAAAEYGAEASEMLKGVPLPPSFNPRTIPNRHLTTNKYQIGKAVGGAVACAWFGDWFEARADRDQAAAREARGELLGSGGWPVFREISKEGLYPALVIKFAEALPSGRFGHNRPLLGIVDKSCTEIGFPIVPQN